MKIPVEHIVNNIPVTWDDEKERDEFLESLREQGQLHAIIVRRLNDTGGYEVVTGAKRYEAAKLLGWAEIDAEVKAPNDIDAKIMRVHDEGVRQREAQEYLPDNVRCEQRGSL